MAENFDTSNKPSNQEEKRVYSALLVVAVAALILGFWQLKNNIRLPFILNAPTNTATTAEADESLLALQNKDTDGDSLTDYDEVYVYATSAFLADTDSDGYPDNEEISTGNTPLCPAKETCLVAPPALAVAEVAPQTVQELRSILIQSGVSAEQLATIDDATLMQLYDQVSIDTPESADASTTTNTDSTAGTPVLTEAEKEIFRKMSGAELRTYFIQSGVDAEMLQGIDDATLKLLVNQTLGL